MRIILRCAGALAAAAAVLTLGLSTPAGAQTSDADDSPSSFQFVENLPAATDTLVEGLQTAVDTATETQSMVETSYDVIQGVALTGTALFEGDASFQDLGIAPWLVERETRFALDDYLGVVDGTHGPDDLLTVEDVQTMVDNAEPALDLAVERGTTAILEASDGELVDAIYSTVSLVALPDNGGVPFHLSEGTNLEEENRAPVAAADALFFVVGSSEYGGNLDLAEATLAPVFEAVKPAIAPITNLLRGL